MVNRSDLIFIKEWAMYLKKRQITNPAVVLTHKPSNPQQLAFILEIIVQIEILRSIDYRERIALPYPIHVSLASCLQEQTIINLFNQGLVQSMLANYQELHIQTRNNAGNKVLLSLMVGILTQISKSRVLVAENNIFQLLKIIGKWGCLLKQKNNMAWPDVLLELKRWPSLKILVGCEYREEFIDLILTWAMEIEAKSIQQTMETFPEFENQEKLLKQWMRRNSAILLSNIKTINFDHVNQERIVLQSKMIAKICGFKGCKSRRQVLKGLKDIILSLFAETSMQKQFCSVFVILFTQLQIICKESAEDISSVLTVEDLISNEGIFYATLWGLEDMDMLHCFNSFTSFMRNYSAKSVLQINRKIVNEMANPRKRTGSIEQAIDGKDRSLLFEFNYCPVSLSKTILTFYLSKSGITLPTSPNQRLLSKRRLRPTLKPIILDPLHFMLVKSHFWDDLFHRDVLQLSLWVILDSYCKWLQQVKPKDISDKQLAEYCKKVSLAIIIFLLDLNYPTKLLQYYPIESDAIKEIIVQPIFPTILLKNKFFFSSYKRNQGQLQKRMESELQSWALPWSHLLANPKSMVHYLHFARGYELALAFICHYRTSFDRIFGDFFVFRITAQLQSLGINLMGIQKEINQKVSFIDAERKKCMIALLHESERCSDKIAQSARKLLEILQ